MTGFTIIFLTIVIIIDIYVFQGFRAIFPGKVLSHWAHWLYMGGSIYSYSVIILYILLGKDSFYFSPKIFLFGLAQAIIFMKVFMLPFVLISDIARVLEWIVQLLPGKPESVPVGEAITRSQFINRVGLLLGGTMFGGFLYGMARGAYNLSVKRISVPIPNLPPQLEGLRIVQISDIHLGSFASTDPVRKAVEAINREQPDIFFFTGDFVNDKASESFPHLDTLKKIKARYGKYSILGNHDYGHYVEWESEEVHQRNFLSLLDAQKKIGWDLLLDENRILNINGARLAVAGVQYWGKNARWGQYGDLDKALDGTDQADLKLLLSHDPSHWDLVVSQQQKYEDLAITFAGHTHGFQFGIEIPGMKWSPSQMVYPHWAGLYKNKQQYLYVNRGLGFLGFPGRIGIPPEITVITLINEEQAHS